VFTYLATSWSCPFSQVLNVCTFNFATSWSCSFSQVLNVLVINFARDGFAVLAGDGVRIQGGGAARNCRNGVTVGAIASHVTITGVGAADPVLVSLNNGDGIASSGMGTQVARALVGVAQDGKVCSQLSAGVSQLFGLALSCLLAFVSALGIRSMRLHICPSVLRCESAFRAGVLPFCTTPRSIRRVAGARPPPRCRRDGIARMLP
jgi:hypothetical protein